MSDAGEGLVDADARLQERMDEQRERRRAASGGTRDPERIRMIESLRLARAELQRQAENTQHPVRKEQIAAAIAELDKRLAEATA